MTYIINRSQCQYFKKLQISLSIASEKSDETIDYIPFAFVYGYNEMTPHMVIFYCHMRSLYCTFCILPISQMNLFGRKRIK